MSNKPAFFMPVVPVVVPFVPGVLLSLPVPVVSVVPVVLPVIMAVPFLGLL